jgi:hypothetical protein
MMAWRRGATGIVIALLVGGCSEDKGGSKVLDAVVASTDAVFKAIEEDEMWLMPLTEGFEVSGTLTGSGSVQVTGWRHAVNEESSTGFHLVFSEKLNMQYSSYASGAVVLNGLVTLTRHSHDFGQAGAQVDDASRMTSYRGAVAASGEVAGSFEVDVHTFAAGTTLWTCGLVNDEEQGNGPCF